MNTMRFVSSCIITAILFAFVVVLFGPTSELVSDQYGEALGPGAVPAFCLTGIAVLGLGIFITELRRYLRLRGEAEDPNACIEAFGVRLGVFLKRSGIAIALLWLYILLWQWISFVPASLFFANGLAICGMKPEQRTPGRLIKSVIILSFFCLVVWFIFARLLLVPLR